MADWQIGLLSRQQTSQESWYPYRTSLESCNRQLVTWISWIGTPAGPHQQLDEVALAGHGQESCGERQFTGKDGDHTPVTTLPETPNQDSGLASGSDEVSECTPTADLPQVARRLEFVSGSPSVGASQTRSPVGRLTPQVVVCRATGSPPWQAEDSSWPAHNSHTQHCGSVSVEQFTGLGKHRLPALRQTLKSSGPSVSRAPPCLP